MLMGRVDELQNGKFYGWAFNEDQPEEHLVIRIMRGAQVVATGVANMERRDLKDSGLGDGDHAFEILAPPNITSFQGLMIIAQSQRAGEIPLPIATNDDRRFDEMFSAYAEQYGETLVAFKEEIDTLKKRCKALETDATKAGSPTELPADLTQRLVSLESRLDSTEVFIVRIDEMVRQLAEEHKKTKGKKRFGLF
jgi:hypothetical protein